MLLVVQVLPILQLPAGSKGLGKEPPGCAAPTCTWNNNYWLGVHPGACPCLQWVLEVHGGALLGLRWGVVPTASLPMWRPRDCPTCYPPSCWTCLRAGRPGGAPSPAPWTSLSAST
ncbi:hypothetical protein Nmel_014305 [Mimus melanotis]